MSRGQLIVIEGLDRTGKSTQASLLLKKLPPDTLLIKFPYRSSPIGKLINHYLSEKSFIISDQAIHLMFSANRWEFAKKIKQALILGTHVILDRYVYSGVAYSAAKNLEGIDINWCLQSDKGLPKPDLTLFLSTNSNSKRKGFGDERYENIAFQESVKSKFCDIFNAFEDPEYCKQRVKHIDVSEKNINQVSEEIWTIVEKQLSVEAHEIIYF